MTEGKIALFADNKAVESAGIEELAPVMSVWEGFY